MEDNFTLLNQSVDHSIIMIEYAEIYMDRYRDLIGDVDNFK